jgi:hypothetical protein
VIRDLVALRAAMHAAAVSARDIEHANEQAGAA